MAEYTRHRTIDIEGTPLYEENVEEIYGDYDIGPDFVKSKRAQAMLMDKLFLMDEFKAVQILYDEAEEAWFCTISFDVFTRYGHIGADEVSRSGPDVYTAIKLAVFEVYSRRPKWKK